MIPAGSMTPQASVHLALWHNKQLLIILLFLYTFTTEIITDPSSLIKKSVSPAQENRCIYSGWFLILPEYLQELFQAANKMTSDKSSFQLLLKIHQYGSTRRTVASCQIKRGTVKEIEAVIYGTQSDTFQQHYFRSQ